MVSIQHREQANTVLKRVYSAQEEQQLLQTDLLAQTDKIQELETRLATVQYNQANGASSIAPSVPGRVPASISTSDTALTKESIKQCSNHGQQHRHWWKKKAKDQIWIQLHPQ